MQKPPNTIVAPYRDRGSARGTVCRECGDPRGPRYAYCSDKCEATFLARRASRAAKLYDLVMDGSTPESVASLVASWRAEDIAKRAGRTSWQTPRAKPDKASVRESYERGEKVAVICAEFGIRPSSLYRLVSPNRDHTGRMGGARG